MRSIWLRTDLENFKKRLIASEKQVAENGIILTDEQFAALERKKHDEACGEIETAHPGYLSSQDTFYVGNLKDVGRIYQQTVVVTVWWYFQIDIMMALHSPQQIAVCTQTYNL
ncbi:hypothetical protein VroAM7_11090 [Vibrio rotiferianus]|uniref:Integrase catalytic domain-containing protein n=1 Tax=Vibrio rotiferianus TaxID=190895 RepID=A0A510I7S3_9VIBR|nr:hypothetical protein VroAM7_11090 [Vibrio rotiferianus]